jgi:hypothetical protein
MRRGARIATRDSKRRSKPAEDAPVRATRDAAVYVETLIVGGWCGGTAQGQRCYRKEGKPYPKEKPRSVCCR